MYVSLLTLDNEGDGSSDSSFVFDKLEVDNRVIYPLHIQQNKVEPYENNNRSQDVRIKQPTDKKKHRE